MMAKSLLKLGIKKGDIVTIYTPNLYQSLVIFKAANQIGAVVTFLNDEASEEELIKYLNLYNSPLLVTYGKDNFFANNVVHASQLEVVINIDPEEVESREQKE